MEFGTNTTSFGLTNGEVGFLIDNGTGVPNTVEFLKAKGVKSVYGLQTHFHLDHTAGLPLNQLLFVKGGIVKTFAPVLSNKKFDHVLDKSFETESWPVSPKMFHSNPEIENFNPGDVLKEIWVKTLPVSHPGGSVAYRFSLPFGDVVIATDSELADEPHATAMAGFIAGASLVYFDVQYRDSEYEGALGIGNEGNKMPRKGWGHSTPSMIRRVLEMSATLPGGIPKQIVIGHHDSKRNDIDLALFEQEVKALLFNFPTAVRFAREGDVYNIG